MGLDPKLTERNLALQNVTQAVVPILFDMHHQGIPFSDGKIENSVIFHKSRGWKARLSSLKQKLYSLARTSPFNLDSHGPNGQFRKFLYGTLGLRQIKESNRPDAKVIANKYAVALLQYETQSDPRLSEIFATIIEIRKLQHSYRNFVKKLTIQGECPACMKNKQAFACPVCGGTGHGDPIGYDYHYVTIKDIDGRPWAHLHPTFIQNQLTHRVGCLDPNWQQFSRDNEIQKIYVRDHFYCPPGWTYVFCDLKKAERKFAAVFFNDPVMLDEVSRDTAIAEFAADMFGLPMAQCMKGTQAYSNAKIILYATQLLGGGRTAHEWLMQSYVYFPEDQCWQMVAGVLKKYSVYYNEIYDRSWEALERGYWTTYHGQLFPCRMPYELSGYKSWKEVKYSRREKALNAFEAHSRAFAATSIQGPATGMHLQIATRMANDEINRRPHLLRAGARLMGVRHDELAGIAPVPLAQELADIFEKSICSFEQNPYLTPNPDYAHLHFGMSAEVEIQTQWSVNLKKLGQDANIKDGVLYRV